MTCFHTIARPMRGVAVCFAAMALTVLTSCGSPSGDQAVPTVSQPPGMQPKGATETGLPVDRVIDGDTIKVMIDGQDVTVRLIGMNTPETVKPNSPIECFGPESSDFAKQVLTGQRVTLEFDDTQGTTDRYGRTLAYVWLEGADGSLRLFNWDSIAAGYAFERQYGSTPYAWKEEFADAAARARSAGAGLWGACGY